MVQKRLMWNKNNPSNRGLSTPLVNRLLEIGSRLKKERVRLGLNQTEMGEIGGVAKNTQHNYEKGERNPDSAYLAAVAAAGVDVLYVLTGQRTPQAEQALSVREQTVVYNFRVLSEADKAAMQRLSGALAKSPVDQAGSDESP